MMPSFLQVLIPKGKKKKKKTLLECMLCPLQRMTLLSMNLEERDLTVGWEEEETN